MRIENVISTNQYCDDASNVHKEPLMLQTNTKLKLLVRSHAMRESTSPPREPHGNGPTSPHSPQSADGEKKIICSLSPNSGAKLNNNESIFNSNLCSAQSPKQMRNTATSPTCRAPSRNGKTIFFLFFLSFKGETI